MTGIIAPVIYESAVTPALFLGLSSTFGAIISSATSTNCGEISEAIFSFIPNSVKIPESVS